MYKLEGHNKHQGFSKDLNNDKDLVDYFRKVIDRRQKMEELKTNNVKLVSKRLRRHKANGVSLPLGFGAHSDFQIAFVCL